MLKGDLDEAAATLFNNLKVSLEVDIASGVAQKRLAQFSPRWDFRSPSKEEQRAKHVKPTLIPIKDPKSGIVTGLVGYDVGEREKMEEDARREQQEKERVIVSTIPGVTIESIKFGDMAVGECLHHVAQKADASGGPLTSFLATEGTAQVEKDKKDEMEKYTGTKLHFDYEQDKKDAMFFAFKNLFGPIVKPPTAGHFNCKCDPVPVPEPNVPLTWTEVRTQLATRVRHALGASMSIAHCKEFKAILDKATRLLLQGRALIFRTQCEKPDKDGTKQLSIIFDLPKGYD